MSKAHAKATDTTIQEAPAATADAGALPVVQPTEGATAPDTHHGQGGLYTMKEGRRVLIAQTKPETTKERK